LDLVAPNDTRPCPVAHCTLPRQIHLFGAALGGFVAQKVAEATANAQRVQSLILCLAFSDTAYFRAMPAPSLYNACTETHTHARHKKVLSAFLLHKRFSSF
jgi:hypothetical protein